MIKNDTKHPNEARNATNHATLGVVSYETKKKIDFQAPKSGTCAEFDSKLDAIEAGQSQI